MSDSIFGCVLRKFKTRRPLTAGCFPSKLFYYIILRIKRSQCSIKVHRSLKKSCDSFSLKSNHFKTKHLHFIWKSKVFKSNGFLNKICQKLPSGKYFQFLTFLSNFFFKLSVDLVAYTVENVQKGKEFIVQEACVKKSMPFSKAKMAQIETENNKNFKKTSIFHISMQLWSIF